MTCRLINIPPHVTGQADSSNPTVDSMEVDPLIPVDFFTPDKNSSANIRPKPLTEADLASAIQPSSCICDLHIGLNKPTTGTVTQFNAVTNSPISPPTQLPDLIDLESIRKAQQDDVILKQVRQWIDKGERPKELQKLRLPPDLLKYWRQFSLLTVRNNVLFRKWINHNKDKDEIEIEMYPILVPESLITDILE